MVHPDKEKMKKIKNDKRKIWRKRKQERMKKEHKEKLVQQARELILKEQQILPRKITKESSTQVEAVAVTNESALKCLSRGEEMVRLSAMKNSKAKEPARPHQSLTASQTNKREKGPKLAKKKLAVEIKELDASLLNKSPDVNALGSGTYGTCYLGKYRSMQVAIKELKSRKKDLADLRKAVYREGQVLTELGDHRGLPFLFGICSKTEPVCLVMLFHGEGTSALTVYGATKCSPALSKADWRDIFKLIVEAIEYIHSQGYIHNDLKANNVVLEGRPGNFNPVIIDFGNSIKAADAKSRRPQPQYLKDNDSYIAPEILDGSGKPSFSSDVYSFGKMMLFVCKRCGFQVNRVIEASTCHKAELRPSLEQLITSSNTFL